MTSNTLRSPLHSVVRNMLSLPGNMDKVSMLPRVAFAPAFLVVSLCAACSPIEESDVEESTAESAAALITDNGAHLNGIQLNGAHLNGIQVNGIQVNGIQVNGIQVNGIQVNGSTLSGAVAGGCSITGIEFVGATMTATLSNGASLPIRVDDVESTPDPASYLYTVSYWDGSTWQNVCGSDAAGPIQGYVLRGFWDETATHVDDPSMFTFACRGAVLAKCVDMGYKPWRSVQECKGTACRNVSLAPVHQACTRMLRADYCGDGVAHTQNGTPVNVWDAFSIQTESPVSSGWKLEAEWSPSGAVCLKDLRYNIGSVTSEYIDDHCPSRWSTFFSCFGNNSTFFTKYGFAKPVSSRSLIRNSFDYEFVYNQNNL
jgi:hypothetical protein